MVMRLKTDLGKIEFVTQIISLEARQNKTLVPI